MLSPASTGFHCTLVTKAGYTFLQEQSQEDPCCRYSQVNTSTRPVHRHNSRNAKVCKTIVVAERLPKFSVPHRDIAPPRGKRRARERPHHPHGAGDAGPGV